MDLSNLRPADGAKQSDNFRRGRGHGSGQLVRDTKVRKLVLEHGTRFRRVVRSSLYEEYLRGFTNRNSKTIVRINVSALEVFDNDAIVS